MVLSIQVGCFRKEKISKLMKCLLNSDLLIYASLLNSKGHQKKASLPGENGVNYITEERQTYNPRMKFQLHRKMELADTRVEIITHDLPQMKHAFVIKNLEKSFIVLAESQEERDLWVKDITRVIDLNRPSTRTIRSKSMVERESIRVDSKDRNAIANSIMEMNAISSLDTSVETAPIWVHDDASHFCMLCQKQFGLLTRKVRI